MAIISNVDLKTGQIPPRNDVKIDDQLRRLNDPSARPMPREAGANETATAADKVTLSGIAETLGRTRELPVIDMQKVEETRRTIREGTYAVSAEGIANGLIKADMALAG